MKEEEKKTTRKTNKTTKTKDSKIESDKKKGKTLKKDNIKAEKKENKALKKDNTKEEKIVESSNVKEKKVTRRKTEKNEDVKETTVVKKSVEFSLIEVIVIVIITGIVVSIASGFIVYNNYDKINNNPIVSYKGDLDEVYVHYNKILDNYIEEVDKQKLIESAIAGMYNYLGDEYSMYLDEENTSDLEEQLHGEYTGIGIEIRTDFDEKNNGTIIINRVFENSPAEEAGLKEGDIITKVDGKEMKDANEVSSTIKGGNKESYEITYIRNGKESTLTLTRKRVFINSVSKEVHGSVGYLKIDTFSATTKDQVEKALNSFDKNIKSLVIDLRDNTGGYLDTAYDVSNLFLEKGKVVYQLKNRSGETTSYKADKGVYRKFNKIVVLINENSASASEILTLALKESAGATVVGVKSYGKGTVQETNDLKSGSMIKYTTSYWLSPNGNSINKKGIEPDIKVEKVEKQKEEAIKAAK